MTAIRQLPATATIEQVRDEITLIGLNVYEGAETNLVDALADTANWDSAKLLASELLNLTAYQLLEAPSHGRVSGDIGKPLSDSAVFDDVNSGHWPSSVLCKIIDSNTLGVALPGMVITAPVALLEFGAAHDFSTHKRNAWWDKSANSGAGWYRPLRQTDAIRGTPAVIQILTVGATTFTAMVRPLEGQRLRLAPEYTITGTDVTNQYAGVLPSGIALDGEVRIGGIVLSSADATFNGPAGTVNWTGLGFAGKAQAGMIIQLLYEPYL